MLVGLAWINTRRTTLTLNPGRLEPSVTLPRGPMEVPLAKRPSLLATFNSAFKLSDDRSGFILNGRAYAPMRNGQATLVGYTDGSVDVVDWRYGPTAPANVSFARQNLPLIVDEGAAAANVANTAEWGTTVGNADARLAVGIGVDRHGNLIYAAGEDQTVASLARALIRAGAVRAMELDINSYWVSFISYGSPDAGEPHNLMSGWNVPDALPGTRRSRLLRGVRTLILYRGPALPRSTTIDTRHSTRSMQPISAAIARPALMSRTTHATSTPSATSILANRRRRRASRRRFRRCARGSRSRCGRSPDSWAVVPVRRPRL